MWKEFNGQVQSKKQIHKNIMKLQLLISYHWTLGHCGDSSLKKTLIQIPEPCVSVAVIFKPDQGGKRIFSDHFGIERLIENRTRLGTCINYQLQ